MLLAYNLMMGFIIDTYNAPFIFDRSRIDNHIAIEGGYVTENKQGETSIMSGASYNQKESYLDILKRTASLFNLLMKGVTAPLWIITTETMVETVVISVLYLFWMFVHITAMIELVFIFKNHKWY